MPRRPLNTAFLLAIASCLPSVVLMTSSYDDYSRLYTEMTTGRYNPHTRPVRNQSHPLTVYVIFHIVSLLRINELDQTMDINAYIDFSWNDEIRTWDPACYSDITVIRPDPSHMWRPRNIISNSVGKSDIFEDNYIPASIKYNGESKWSPGSVFSTSCDMDFTYFPFDQQECRMFFFFYNSEREVKVTKGQQEGRLFTYSTNGEWDIVFSTIEIISSVNKDVPAAFIVRFKLQRRPDFFVFNVVIPLVIMSALSSLVFVLPETSGERASFSTTMLLSQTFFMGTVTGELPHRSDTFPIIVFYIFSLFILNCICVIAAVLQLRCHTRPSKSVASKTYSDVKTAHTAAFQSNKIPFSSQLALVPVYKYCGLSTCS
ncbi:neuronal acetylcholine receptor subunit alpha-3-like [Aplysia californica]|uniref:Neuronal acetylcholine receptor subunit alpha-3-like n=1 Tax=Aplysia californica TaxID=6500 RepID=A0ABM0JYW9_APLCA|nr:neuronal acetylcholine receptor subunit alpha-3-like [Aplysia californica]